ncbi:MAG: hypothetical protein ACNA7J_05910 [Wenzhouxiangella sp.]
MHERRAQERQEMDSRQVHMEYSNMAPSEQSSHYYTDSPQEWFLPTAKRLKVPVIGKVAQDETASPSLERQGIGWIAGAFIGLGAAAMIAIPPLLLGMASLSAVAGCAAWALGWIYLVWALEAQTIRAAVLDFSLAAVSLGVGLLIIGQAPAVAGLLAMHALASIVRLKVDAANARATAVPLIVFSSALALGAIL